MGLGLQVRAGRVVDPSTSVVPDGFAELARRLAERPFAAPDVEDLAALRLDHRAVATLVAAGLVLRLAGEVVLLPDAPARAAQVLGTFRRPFTVAEAKNALGTSRRVAIPLLEHLDAVGITVRLNPTERLLRPV